MYVLGRYADTLYHSLAAQVKMGRDHTIYATVPGYVRFYKEPGLRKDRRYVGVVLNRGEKLPRDEAELGRSRYTHIVDLNALEQPTTATSSS